MLQFSTHYKHFRDKIYLLEKTVKVYNCISKSSLFHQDNLEIEGAFFYGFQVFPLNTYTYILFDRISA